MGGLRENPPTKIGGDTVKTIKDYKNSIEKCIETNETKKIELPVSDVVHFTMNDESWACVRPSGTEPKIKLYFGTKLLKEALEKDADDKLKLMKNDLKKFTLLQKYNRLSDS